MDGDKKRKRPWGWMLAGAAALTVATGALAGVDLGKAVQDLHAMHHGDRAGMDKHVDAMIDSVLSDGTPEQKARFKASIEAVHADLAATHAQLGKAHERMLGLLTQPTIDRAAVEAFRAEQMAQMDMASKRLVNRLTEAAETLTPAQRARLAEHVRGM